MLAMFAGNWWVLHVRGLIALIFGFHVLLWPFFTEQAQILLFGAYVLVDGIFAVLSGISSYGDKQRWWPVLFKGIAGILIGILALLWPEPSGLVLLYLIAAWTIVTGVLEIAAAIQLRRAISAEWRLILFGLASISLGVLLIAFPTPLGFGPVWLIGAYGIISGVLLHALAFRLRPISRELEAAAPAPT